MRTTSEWTTTVWTTTTSTTTMSTTTSSTTTKMIYTEMSNVSRSRLVPYSAVGPNHCASGQERGTAIFSRNKNNRNKNVPDTTRLHYFATTFFTRVKRKAFGICELYDCDIIVEWSGHLGRRRHTGWDIGKLDTKMCPQNQAMRAKVIWYKQD